MANVRYRFTQMERWRLEYVDTEIENILWRHIEESCLAGDFQMFLLHFPCSQFSQRAAERLLDIAMRADDPQGEPLRFESAVREVIELANNGNALAQFHAGKFYDLGRGVATNRSESNKRYRLAAFRGEPRAAFNYACNILDAPEGPEDQVAVYYLKLSVELGEKKAECFLAFEKLRGRLPIADAENPLEILVNAYECDVEAAANYLAEALFKGLGCQANTSEAIIRQERAAELSHLPSQFNFGLRLIEGLGVPVNRERGESLLLKAAEHFEPFVLREVGLYLLRDQANEATKLKGVYFLKLAAALGDAAAQGNLGVVYTRKKEAVPNWREAVRWFRNSIVNGSNDSIERLAHILETGASGVEPNPDEAEALRHRAAALGFPRSQYLIARKLGLKPRDEISDEERSYAFQLAKLSAFQGYNTSKALLGSFYAEGLGTEKNFAKAIELWTAAANAGDIWSQEKLGVSHLLGDDLPRDYQKAAYWLSQAAEDGESPYAARYVAIMFEEGWGFQRNSVEAFKWMTYAAVHGNADAMYRLSEYLRRGIGCSVDINTSLDWLEKAAASGHAGAKGSVEARQTKEPINV
jgi:uncharacterized protein